MKCIVGATYTTFTSSSPELQIWRPLGNTAFQKLNSTVMTSSREVLSGIYEFAVDPPLTVELGDVLGLFEPPLLESTLLVHYDAGDNTNMSYLTLTEDVLEPSHTLVDVNSGSWQRGNALPLVSVEISKLHNVYTYSYTSSGKLCCVALLCCLYVKKTHLAWSWWFHC